MNRRDPVKVVLTTVSDESEYIETPWAIPVGPSSYELDNLPFYAYGLSLGDRFLAEPTSDDPRPHFRRILQKSGNRTIRVIFDPGIDQSDESRSILDQIVSLGCSYEGANSRYIVINIPAEADFEHVCLFATKSGVQWEHADPSYEELYPQG